LESLLGQLGRYAPHNLKLGETEAFKSLASGGSVDPETLLYSSHPLVRTEGGGLQDTPLFNSLEPSQASQNQQQAFEQDKLYLSQKLRKVADSVKRVMVGRHSEDNESRLQLQILEFEINSMNSYITSLKWSASAGDLKSEDEKILELRKQMIAMVKEKKKLEKKCEDRKVSIKKLYFVVQDRGRTLKKAHDAMETLREMAKQFQFSSEKTMLLQIKQIDGYQHKVDSLAAQILYLRHQVHHSFLPTDVALAHPSTHPYKSDKNGAGGEVHQVVVSRGAGGSRVERREREESREEKRGGPVQHIMELRNDVIFIIDKIRKKYQITEGGTKEVLEIALKKLDGFKTQVEEQAALLFDAGVQIKSLEKAGQFKDASIDKLSKELVHIREEKSLEIRLLRSKLAELTEAMYLRDKELVQLQTDHQHRLRAQEETQRLESSKKGKGTQMAGYLEANVRIEDHLENSERHRGDSRDQNTFGFADTDEKTGKWDPNPSYKKRPTDLSQTKLNPNDFDSLRYSEDWKNMSWSQEKGRTGGERVEETQLERIKGQLSQSLEREEELRVRLKSLEGSLASGVAQNSNGVSKSLGRESGIQGPPGPIGLAGISEGSMRQQLEKLKREVGSAKKEVQETKMELEMQLEDWSREYKDKVYQSVEHTAFLLDDKQSQTIESLRRENIELTKKIGEIEHQLAEAKKNEERTPGRGSAVNQPLTEYSEGTGNEVTGGSRGETAIKELEERLRNERKARESSVEEVKMKYQQQINKFQEEMKVKEGLIEENCKKLAKQIQENESNSNDYNQKLIQLEERSKAITSQLHTLVAENSDLSREMAQKDSALREAVQKRALEKQELVNLQKQLEEMGVNLNAAKSKLSRSEDLATFLQDKHSDQEKQIGNLKLIVQNKDEVYEKLREELSESRKTNSQQAIERQREAAMREEYKRVIADSRRKESKILQDIDDLKNTLQRNYSGSEMINSLNAEIEKLKRENLQSEQNQSQHVLRISSELKQAQEQNSELRLRREQAESALGELKKSAENRNEEDRKSYDSEKAARVKLEEDLQSLEQLLREEEKQKVACQEQNGSLIVQLQKVQDEFKSLNEDYKMLKDQLVSSKEIEKELNLKLEEAQSMLEILQTRKDSETEDQKTGKNRDGFNSPKKSQGTSHRGRPQVEQGKDEETVENVKMTESMTDKGEGQLVVELQDELEALKNEFSRIFLGGLIRFRAEQKQKRQNDRLLLTCGFWKTHMLKWKREAERVNKLFIDQTKRLSASEQKKLILEEQVIIKDKQIEQFGAMKGGRSDHTGPVSKPSNDSSNKADQGLKKITELFQETLVLVKNYIDVEIPPFDDVYSREWEYFLKNLKIELKSQRQNEEHLQESINQYKSLLDSKCSELAHLNEKYMGRLGLSVEMKGFLDRDINISGIQNLSIEKKKLEEIMNEVWEFTAERFQV
jgi:hypothetical protein